MMRCLETIYRNFDDLWNILYEIRETCMNVRFKMNVRLVSYYYFRSFVQNKMVYTLCELLVEMVFLPRFYFQRKHLASYKTNTIRGVARVIELQCCYTTLPPLTQLPVRFIDLLTNWPRLVLVVTV